MKEPMCYTLGEVEALALVLENYDVLADVRELMQCIPHLQKRVAEYKAADDHRAIVAPKEMSGRQLKNLDAELLNSCVIVCEASEGGAHG
jgi:hypothetical protein